MKVIYFFEVTMFFAASAFFCLGSKESEVAA